MIEPSRLLWGLFTCAVCTGCTLISLDALQSSSATSSTSASTGLSPAASSTTTSASGVTTTSNVSGSSSSGMTTTTASASSGGCTDAFCAGVGSVDGCADFDSASFGLGAAFQKKIIVSGTTTGTVVTATDQFVSCPSSARLDIVGHSGDNSYVEVTRDITLGTKTKVTAAASSRRTGPNGPLDTSILQVDYQGDTSDVDCQLFLSLFDSPNPSAYMFQQTQIGNTSTTLEGSGASLPAATGDQWANASITFDWSVTPPVANATVNGATFSIVLDSPCAGKPATLTPNWGFNYDDRVQTMYLDNLTTKVQ